MGLLALWLAVGCAPDPGAPALGSCDARGQSRVAVVNALRFARQTDGVSWGFDLDESGTDSDAGCGVRDYTDPDGNPGIDNAFATLIPILELTEAGAVEPLITAAIASGELLFLLSLDELDDPASDACVDFSFARGEGDPDLDAGGLILPGQTFDVYPEVAPIAFPDLPMREGALTARPFNPVVPITFFDVSLEFELNEAAIRVEQGEDGAMRGYFGGGLDTETLVTLAAERSSDPTLADTVRDLLALAADLAPDENGDCQQVSITFEFEAVSAFFFE